MLKGNLNSIQNKDIYVSKVLVSSDSLSISLNNLLFMKYFLRNTSAFLILHYNLNSN